MTRITEAERVFLSRAEAVTEKKRTRAAHYQQQLQNLIAELQHGDVSTLMQILKIAAQLENTQAQQNAHIQKVNQLRAKQQTDRSVIRLCADANTIAGTDGANFFTKAGKVFKTFCHFQSLTVNGRCHFHPLTGFGEAFPLFCRRELRFPTLVDR